MHNWGPSHVGHGVQQCTKCGMTLMEATALDRLHHCDIADEPNFSGTAPTLGEVRSDKSNLACDWSPRDALINVLRMIDNGEIDPAALLVTWTDKDYKKTHFRVSSPSSIITFGLIENVKHLCVER